jgi:hypothetical protein
MTNQKASKSHQVFWKTFVCVSLSAFYIAMLAWPFGLSEQGYMASRALLAGSIMLAISIPAWIINIKREFMSDAAREAQTGEAREQVIQKIGQLAMNNKWLTPEEVRQVIFCQKADGKKFGQVAVKRNYLTLSQVKSLLSTQSSMKRNGAVEAIDV